MQGQSTGAMMFDAVTARGLSFAREPDPELDKEFDETDEPVVLGSPEPSPKPPHLRPWLLILLLLMVAGGTYLASDPSLVLELIGQGPPSPAPSPLPESPITQAPAEAPTPAPAAPEPSPTLPVTPPPGPGTVPAPYFAEGQRVTIQPDAVSPTAGVPLFADVERTRPGPTVRAGSTLTVLDAELLQNGWIYSVRTDGGAKGWIAEARLAAK